MDIITRANTIKLSRPIVWDDLVRYEEDIDRVSNARWYILGDVPPRHPVPAPILEAEFHDIDEDSPFHSSVIINEKDRGMVAIWDFDFDRAMDFNYKYGVYVHEKDMQAGIEKYLRGR